jgi:pimeloyl-ACP methyl ester carboxylesterase
VSGALIRRRFFDLPSGQLHLRVAEGNGTRTPLVALHQASGSSKALEPLLRAFAATRNVIAPDLPGNGDSTRLEKRDPAIADFAAALAPLIDAQPGPVDLYGFHAGASVALELAILRPKHVRRIVIDSLGLYTPEQGRQMAGDYVPDLSLDRHGAHLLRAWHVVRDTYLFWPWFQQDAAHARAVGVPELRQLHDKVIEVLKSVDSFGDLYRAAFLHAKDERLPLVAQPALVTAGRSNTQHGHLAAIAARLPRASVLETDGTYSAESAVKTAAAIAAWLDAEAK